MGYRSSIDHGSITDHNTTIGQTLMVQGTASDVGKSLITAALCRIFTQDGYRTAPFKSQNMSLNSYVTWDGKEIGRAQGMQADACGIAATTDMNPILLKPTGEMSSQVVVHGKPLRDYEAKEYRESYLPIAGGIARESLRILRESYDIVVLEGAGSPAEINLKDRDIVNMNMAVWADAPVVLVADIDRGGVFASIVGTLELLEPHERDRVCGFVINKFRGDVALLQPGLDWLEERTGKPVLGVLPFLPGLELEDEDSLSLSGAKASERSRRAGLVTQAGPLTNMQDVAEKLDIIVIKFPRISNFTDMDPLFAEPDVDVRFVEQAHEWGSPDLILLPGSKNTIVDLAWLREQGLADLVIGHIVSGGRAAAICGGYEMLGECLLDPFGVESSQPESQGLGLFPFNIEFQSVKTTIRVEGTVRLGGNSGSCPVDGYEIHMGQMVPLSPDLQRPFLIREKRFVQTANSEDKFQPEGVCTQDGKVWGTFIHGILHNDSFRRTWLNEARVDKGWVPLAEGVRFRERREAAFDRLADAARAHLDLARIYAIAGLKGDQRG
ncbi:cobyric acid synthase [Paenibacillus paeoniae]|uniref:Cobyric acid synthase n=1 Tax=Paenibacillus paeoniae TaxID=2292705 RepID=A0A371PK91_9BACL|nr:cobyric acid synthase [Paenibacillus paeoniae]REK76626.1 cobyric acid synthase [Paenibacillus paeoniae]